MLHLASPRQRHRLVAPTNAVRRLAGAAAAARRGAPAPARDMQSQQDGRARAARERRPAQALPCAKCDAGGGAPAAASAWSLPKG